MKIHVSVVVHKGVWMGMGVPVDGMVWARWVFCGVCLVSGGIS